MSSRVIDERILSMKFDNKQFESAVSTTMNTLTKLKMKLDAMGVTKGLEKLSQATKSVKTDGLNDLSDGVETVQARFSALQVVAMTAISRITNSVMTLGKKLVSAVTVDPIKDGFREYETQMNSVQTILANTQKEGTNVKIVNAALDELNRYADKTIYNFTEMTRNIGTFTAAGVKLNTSVSAIKGIANLAAISGSTSQQASTAMYQLSQAIASGTVRLMDWNSVVNAGMGGQVFQDALIRTSEHLKTGAKAAIAAKGSFRESLQTGWLTTEVLTQTLDQFATAADTQKEYQAAVEKFVKQGYSKEEAVQMANMAKTAGEAATKVKTFTQLIDTIKEALGSGWTTTWRTIIGDFEDARNLWTDISDVLNDAINKSSDARNKIVSGWADLGGRTKLIEGLSNVFKGLASVIKPIQKAFREIFPPTTSKQLLDITENFRKFSEKLVISDKTAENLKRTFKGLFSIADMVKKAFEIVGSTITKVFSTGIFGSVLDIILTITGAIGDMFTAMNDGFKTSSLLESLGKMVSEIAKVFKSAASGITVFGDILTEVGKGVAKALSSIWNGISKVFGWIADNVTVKDIVAGMVGSGVYKTVKSFTDVFDQIGDTIDKIFGKGGGKHTKLGAKISTFFGEVRSAIQAFTTGVNIASLVAIAGALGILAASCRSLASMSIGDLAKSVGSIGAMFLMLNKTFSSISTSIKTFKAKGIVKAGLSAMAIAQAIKILTDALEKLSTMHIEDLAWGLAALAVEMKIFTLGLKSLSKVEIPLSASITMLALAESCDTLGDAMQKFSGIPWQGMVSGLIGMGGALAIFVKTFKMIGDLKTSGMKNMANATALLIAANAMKQLAKALTDISIISWNGIAKGLAGIGVTLGIFIKALMTLDGLKNIGSFNSILFSGSLVLAAKALKPIGDALSEISLISWNGIAKGLAGIGVTLGIFVKALMALDGLKNIGSFNSILFSGSLVLAAKALKPIGDALTEISAISWNGIAKGLAGIGGALGAFVISLKVLDGLEYTGSFSMLLKGGALLLAAQALSPIAKALSEIGSLSWDGVIKGLTGMGFALTELGVVCTILGKIGNVFALLGAASLVLAAQGLEQIAGALQRLGSMSWSEIGKGLAAMAAAIGEVALGSLINTLSGPGAKSIATIAKPLGDLADSVKKWSGIEVPTNLGTSLASLAGGVMAFTFSGFGSGALATVAGPLGTLADSVKKWSDGVHVPKDIGDQLSSLSSGVRSFTFMFGAGGSLGSAAGPLGTLADSVKKWHDTHVPKDIETQLKSVANGVRSFTFLLLGGVGLGAVVGPLGELATSIKKWSGLEIPKDIEKQLKSVANGISSFTSVFLAGFSLANVVGPFGKLVTSIKKLQGLQIPEGIEGDLSSIANSIKKFSNVGDVSAGAKATQTIASAVSKLSGVNYNGVSSGLGSLAKSLSSFGSSAKSLSGVGNSIVSNLINPVKNATKQFSTVGKSISSSIVSGIKSGRGAITSAMSDTVSTIVKILTARNSTFKMIGSGFSKQLSSGIKSGKSGVNSASESLVSGASKKLRSHYSSFNSAGKYLAQGFANGIKSNSYLSAEAARSMGNKAAKILRKALNVHSPSRVTYKTGRFFDMGFANAISDNAFRAINASYNMGNDARKALTKAISKMSNIMDSDINTQPVITPVLDLSNISSGAASINGLFGDTQTVGVRANLNAINTAMLANQNNQNEDVVNAINKLRKDLNNVNTGDTYSINGVYANDDDIIDAIKSIVRAVKVERRV